MRLPSLGNCVDTAVEEVLVEFFNLKMFGSGTKKWFVKRQKRQQHRSGRRPCTRKKKRWTSKVLKDHRQKILSELDVNAVLPYLVYERVFSLVEYKEILGQESSRRRTEVFLDHLSSKGPAAFFSFCSVLEEVCPHLLTCFLLDGEGRRTNYTKNQLRKKGNMTNIPFKLLCYTLLIRCSFYVVYIFFNYIWINFIFLRKMETKHNARGTNLQ